MSAMTRRGTSYPGVSTNVLVGDDPWLAADFVRRATRIASRAIRARGRFALAIPGGSVLPRLIAPLARAAIDWDRTDLFWCDERCVPVADPASNYAAGKALLLDPLDAAGKGVPRVHRFCGEDPDPSLAARRYAADLEATLGVPPSIDLMVLGIGADGHVASLFAGHRALLERGTWAVVEQASPKPPPVRLTVTLPVIAAAELVVVAAFGEAKAAAIREVLASESDLPASLALRAARRCIMYLDGASAQAIDA